ncbi:MAG: AAA family ATPase [Armatimonadetes bacterium]|nr:AAA family ATPase [Armatimonadota bacterium]MBS1726756.1 AAA family ATPase [Armatimonadota bacterium]
MPPRESLEMLDLIEQQVPADNTRLRTYVGALRETLEAEDRETERKNEELSQYREAYEKLTQPANRIGVFLKWTETDNGQLPLILLGDSEYIVTYDPAVPEDALVLGTRVRLNEAYAIVGLAPMTEQGSIVRVAQVLDDGRLRIGGDSPGLDQRLIFLSEELKEAKVHAGDEVRLDATGRVAVEHFVRTENRDLFMEKVPDITWDKVGGQPEAIRLIQETIEHPLLHPEIYEKYGKKTVKGILLYGPPGCGKTLLGKATAHTLAKEYSEREGREVKEYFMAISGPKILNMWVGETERMVREIFRTAREKAKDGYLVFIFMDEAESLLRTRSSGRYFSMSNTVVPQFCAELDGLESLENVVLMLTSNRPDYIDPAVLRPGRIDRKVKVVRPDKDASRQILNIYLSPSLPLDPEIVAKHDGETVCAQREIVEGVLDALWSKKASNEFLEINLRSGKTDTLYRGDLVSGAILESIVDRAKETAIRRTLANPKIETGITLEDLVDALDQEFKENEIFPKSDAMEDWLQLLDLSPENVVSVRPIGRNKGRSYFEKSIV